MMNKLVPQDMFDLAAKLDEYKNQMVVTTSPDKVLGIVNALEEILNPWQNYLSDAIKTEGWTAFSAIKLFRTHDSTRQQIINAVGDLSIKITELARNWSLELCTKCINDTFSHFNTPADIVHFALAIDGAKNDCLKKAFGEEQRPLSELFKRIEYSGAPDLDNFHD